MRVIAGKARGRRLKRVPGDTTRPIMDRAKESLFNILAPRLLDSSWLDMFAGTGAVGIEALSRGAADVLFLDLARQAVRTIDENLQHTGLVQGSSVLRVDALLYVARYAGPPFDFIYIAPPQYKGLWLDALQLVDSGAARLLAPGGTAIVQIDPKEFRETALASLALVDQRRYGKTMLCFYAYEPEEEEE